MPESLQLAYAWGGTATYEPGATFGPRVLEDFELVWILAGHARYIVDGRELDAPNRERSSSADPGSARRTAGTRSAARGTHSCTSR